MARRGGWRPRNYVVPGEVPVCAAGRWGPRRAHVGESAAILAAELVYHQLICDGSRFGPGARARLTWTPDAASTTSWDIEVEVVPHAVWRRGRLFLRCPACQQRATRLYVPIAGYEPRCRRCWGLNYASQSWSYKPVSLCGQVLSSVAYVTTAVRRDERRQAARTRYAARRPFLRAGLEAPRQSPSAPAVIAPAVVTPPPASELHAVEPRRTRAGVGGPLLVDSWLAF